MTTSAEGKWDVFVSHNRRDKQWVRDRVQEWRNAGLRVFFDEDSIVPGEDVVSAIETAITTSRLVVLVLTPSSINSNWVALEAGMALFDDTDLMQRRIIPVKLEPVDAASLRPAIRRLDCVDLSVSSQYQREYRRLQAALGIPGSSIVDHARVPTDRRGEASILPLNVPMPVLSLMGTKGGSGKTTIVVAMAELMASTGHNVLVIDGDLESAGVTKYLGANARSRPQVRTLVDAAFVKHEGATENERADLGAWDVTPPYLREACLGRIYLIPARRTEDTRVAYEALANIQPDSQRNQVALEIIRDAVRRYESISPDIGAILIDSGAEMNPLVSAGIVASDASYIVSGPHAEFARAVNDYERIHRERYPHCSHKDMHVIVNQATADSPMLWSRYADVCFVMEDPEFRARAAAGKVDFEGVGLDNLYLQVLRVLQKTLPSAFHSILPDPVEIWIKPYLKRMKDFPDHLLSRPSYRHLLLFTTLTIVISGLLFLASTWMTVRAVRGPWRLVSVEVSPPDTVTVAALEDYMAAIVVPEEYGQSVSISGRYVQLTAPLSPHDQTALESSIGKGLPFSDATGLGLVENKVVYELVIAALDAAVAELNEARSLRTSIWSFIALLAVAIVGYRIARHGPLSKRKTILCKLVTLRDSGDERELKKWLVAILSKRGANNELTWLRAQYRQRIGHVDPLEMLRGDSDP